MICLWSYSDCSTSVLTWSKLRHLASWLTWPQGSFNSPIHVLLIPCYPACCCPNWHSPSFCSYCLWGMSGLTLCEIAAGCMQLSSSCCAQWVEKMAIWSAAALQRVRGIGVKGDEDNWGSCDFEPCYGRTLCCGSGPSYSPRAVAQQEAPLHCTGGPGWIWASHCGSGASCSCSLQDVKKSLNCSEASRGVSGTPLPYSGLSWEGLSPKWLGLCGSFANNQWSLLYPKSKR